MSVESAWSSQSWPTDANSAGSVGLEWDRLWPLHLRPHGPLRVCGAGGFMWHSHVDAPWRPFSRREWTIVFTGCSESRQPQEWGTPPPNAPGAVKEVTATADMESSRNSAPMETVYQLRGKRIYDCQQTGWFKVNALPLRVPTVWIMGLSNQFLCPWLAVLRKVCSLNGYFRQWI